MVDNYLLCYDCKHILKKYVCNEEMRERLNRVREWLKEMKVILFNDKHHVSITSLFKY